MDVVLLCVYSLFIVWLLCGWAYLIISIKKLIKISKLDIIKKRKIPIIFGILLLFSLYLFFILPAYGLSDFILKCDINFEDSFTGDIQILRNACDYCMIFIFTLIFVLYITRVYLLNYDHQYHNMILNKEWIVLINQNEFNNNYYIKNKTTLGNPKWILKLVIIPLFLIVISIYITLAFFVPTHTRNIKLGYYLINSIFSGIIMLYFWHKFPEEMDTIGLRKELWITCLWLIFGQIFVLLPALSAILFDFKYGYSMTLFGISLMVHICTYLMVHYPYTQYITENEETTNDPELPNRYTCCCRNDIPPQPQLTGATSTSSSFGISWKDYIHGTYIYVYMYNIIHKLFDEYIFRSQKWVQWFYETFNIGIFIRKFIIYY